MAGRGQKVFYVPSEDLREKYKIQFGDRISSVCKAIGKYTQTEISVKVMPNGSVRFEVIGRRIKAANDNIVQEICQRKSSVYTKHGLSDKEQGSEPYSSQRAQQVLSEEKQDEILKEGIEKPYLLTEAALAKHNLLTGASELREFACGPCDHYWWKVVLITKAVSKCHRCEIKYDALPRDKVFGIGRYICQSEGCGHSFFCRCHATEAVRCNNCNNWVHNPYIHPKFRKSKRPRKPLDPNVPAFEPPPPSSAAVPVPLLPVQFLPQIPPMPMPIFLPPQDAAPLKVVKKKKVINPSTPHISTGSTIDTFLTQSVASDIEVQVADSDSDEEIILGESDSDSSSDDADDTPSDTHTVTSDDDTELEVGSMTLQPSGSDSDSEGEGHLGQHKRHVGTDSSDSSSDSDSDGDKPPSSEMGSDKLSSQASALDSGIGTASDVETRSSIDSAKPASVGDNSQVSSGKFNPLRIAVFKPEYPGVLFSKHCAQKEVDHHGTVLLIEGIEVRIPSNAIRPEDKVPVTIQACLKGPFKLPRGYTPISPAYLLYPPCVFHKDVEVIVDIFADIEEEDEIIFATSADKPRIRQQDALWRFEKEHGSADVQCAPGSKKATVKVRHFCFGILARRKRRNQKNFYMISLYRPAVLLSTCHAVFMASLDSEVYIRNFETYLDKKYVSRGENFLDCPQHTRLSEDKVELVLPEVAEGTSITPDKNPCEIKREIIDLPLKHKRFRQSNVSTYPPRIVLTIQSEARTVASLRPLQCSFQVRGAEDSKLTFHLSVSPSPSLSQRSSQADSVEAMPVNPAITYDQFIQRMDIAVQCRLEQECSQEYLRRIANLIPNWLKMAEDLDISEARRIEIGDDHRRDAEMKARRVLELWHKTNGFKATYKILIEVCLSHGNAQLAEKICSILKE